jgi:hypothetical protein
MHRPLVKATSGVTRHGGGALAALVPILLAGMLAGVPAPAEADTQTANPGQATTPKPAKSVSSPTPGKGPAPAARNLPDRFAGRSGAYYKVLWGIDTLRVKWTESGEVIRFSWRVLDPEKAKVLNDKNVEPSLLDPQAGVGLVVPTMEKIGQLRQSASPEVGRSYWMAFSNKGLRVKRGDRVNVVVGPFRAEGLVVD